MASPASSSVRGRRRSITQDEKVILPDGPHGIRVKEAAGGRGVVVVHITESSTSAAGLKVGDSIRSVEGTVVVSSSQCMQLLDEGPRPLSLGVKRDTLVDVPAAANGGGVEHQVEEVKLDMPDTAAGAADATGTCGMYTVLLPPTMASKPLEDAISFKKHGAQFAVRLPADAVYALGDVVRGEVAISTPKNLELKDCRVYLDMGETLVQQTSSRGGDVVVTTTYTTEKTYESEGPTSHTVPCQQLAAGDHVEPFELRLTSEGPGSVGVVPAASIYYKIKLDVEKAGMLSSKTTTESADLQVHRAPPPTAYLHRNFHMEQVPTPISAGSMLYGCTGTPLCCFCCLPCNVASRALLSGRQGTVQATLDMDQPLVVSPETPEITMHLSLANESTLDIKSARIVLSMTGMSGDFAHKLCEDSHEDHVKFRTMTKEQRKAYVTEKALQAQAQVAGYGDRGHLQTHETAICRGPPTAVNLPGVAPDLATEGAVQMPCVVCCSSKSMVRAQAEAAANMEMEQRGHANVEEFDVTVQPSRAILNGGSVRGAELYSRATISMIELETSALCCGTVKLMAAPIFVSPEPIQFDIDVPNVVP